MHGGTTEATKQQLQWCLLCGPADVQQEGSMVCAQFIAINEATPSVSQCGDNEFPLIAADPSTTVNQREI